MRTAQESVHLIAAVVGTTSFAALWAGTLWGTVLRSGWARSRIRHSTVHGIHVHLTLFGLWLGVVHGLAQLADPLGKVAALDVLVPFANRADPVGIGMGVLALEMMLASGLSVLLQRRLGYHRWRGLHSLGYLAFTLVAAHILVSGSDLAAAGPRVAVAVAWAVVVAAGAMTLAPVARLPRLLLDRATSRRRGEEITVNVDPGRCASFGFCEQEAPGIFSLRSDQRLAYKSVAPSDQAEAVVRAAVVCPARAITLGRLPTAVVVAPPDPPEPPVEDVLQNPPPRQRTPPRPAPVFQRPAPVSEHSGPVSQRPAPVPARTVPVADHPSGPVFQRPGAVSDHSGPVFQQPAAVRQHPTAARSQPGMVRQPPGSLPHHPPAEPASELEDTGRHHIRPLRGIPGGRAGGGR